MGRCASVIELGSSTALEHLVKTRRCGFTAIREANVTSGRLTRRTWEVHSRPETTRSSLVHPIGRAQALSTGRRIGLSLITTWSPVRVRPPEPNAGVAQLVEHVTPSSTLIRRLDLVCGQQNTRRHACFDRSQPAGQYPIAKKTRLATTAIRSID